MASAAAKVKSVCYLVFDPCTSEKHRCIKTILKLVTLKKLMQSKVSSRNTETLWICGNRELQNVHYENVKKLANTMMQAQCNGQANWLQLLDEALDKCLHAGKDIPTPTNLHVVLVYDFVNGLQVEKNEKSGRLMANIVRKANSRKVWVYALGPNLPVPEDTLTNHEDVVYWMKTTQQRKGNGNVELLFEIGQQVNTMLVIQDLLGFHLYFTWRFAKAGQPWNVPLSHSVGIKFDVTVNRHYAKEPYVQVKQRNKNISENYMKLEGVTSGYFRHGKFIAKYDKERMKTTRSFNIIGVTDVTNISELHLTEGVNQVIPRVKGSDNASLFDVLVQELHTQEKYLIARKVYSNGNKPKFFCLIPDIKLVRFKLAELPYKNDVRGPCKEESPELAPQVEINQTYYHLMDKMNVTIKENTLKVPLGHKLLLDAQIVDMIHAVINNILEEDLEWEEIEENTTPDEDTLGVIKSFYPDITPTRVLQEADAPVTFGDEFNYD